MMIFQHEFFGSFMDAEMGAGKGNEPLVFRWNNDFLASCGGEVCFQSLGHKLFHMFLAPLSLIDVNWRHRFTMEKPDAGSKKRPQFR
jgi:hypothetical protein